MIRRILVALDLDSDTAVAIRYALEIAQRFGSLVTGLAVVDMGSVEASSKGGGIGSMYYAEKLRERLTEEAREKAHELIELFKSTIEPTDVEHSELVAEGVPFERIIEDTKYHDLLIMGNDPHFFYSHPKHHTHTLAKIIERAIGPTMIVPKKYSHVERVLVATDGSNEVSRAIGRFVQMKPFGRDVQVRIVNASESDSAESELLLQMTKSYMEAHGFQAETFSEKEGSPKETIIRHRESFDAGLIVMGGHTKSSLLAEKLSETTAHLIENTDVPIFMDH